MLEWIESFTLGETSKKWLGTLLAILCLFLIKLLMNSMINRKIKELRNRYIWRQTGSYVTLILGMTAVVTIWFEWFRSILTILTLVAAAITIVSKELLLNFMAYGVIVWRGLFSIGDRIQVGQYAGRCH